MRCRVKGNRCCVSRRSHFERNGRSIETARDDMGACLRAIWAGRDDGAI